MLIPRGAGVERAVGDARCAAEDDGATEDVGLENPPGTPPAVEGKRALPPGAGRAGSARLAARWGVGARRCIASAAPTAVATKTAQTVAAMIKVRLSGERRPAVCLPTACLPGSGGGGGSQPAVLSAANGGALSLTSGALGGGAGAGVRRGNAPPQAAQKGES
jgi:hypothetical protein